MRKYFSVFLFSIFPVLGWCQVLPTLTPSQTIPSFHSSSNGSLPNNINWTTSGQNYNDAGRHFHSSAVMNNRLWVIGGIASGKVMSDVLFSTDGLNWNLATAKAAFGVRWGQASLVFNAGQGANLWVIGGSDSKTFYNDVWQSSDGVNWSLVTAKAPFTARARHGAVVFNNKIWVIGGTSQSGFLNDIWCSSDGKNWTQVTPKETFLPRYSATLTVHHNLLWLIAGQGTTGALNDIWSSADGVNWTNVVPHSGFPARSSHTAEVYKGLLWIFGGHDVDTNSIFNDAWWSANGSQWNQSTPLGNYSPRWAHSSAVFNGQIWIINGANGPKTGPVDYSDIWNMGSVPSPTVSALSSAQSTANATVVVSGGTATVTFAATATMTASSTVALTRTLTPSFTPTRTLTNTPTWTSTQVILTATKTFTVPKTNTATSTSTPQPSLTPVWTAISPASNTLVLSAIIVPHVAHGGKPVKLLLTLAEPALIQWTISSASGEKLYQVSTRGQSGLNTLIWQGTNQLNQPVGEGIYSYVIETQEGLTQITTPGKIFVRH